MMLNKDNLQLASFDDSLMTRDSHDLRKVREGADGLDKSRDVG